MINNANLQKELWAKAVSTACYLVNRSPSVAINCKIPKEFWLGQSCDYSHLRIFGCDAYSFIQKNQRAKLDPKSKCYVFVGYDYAVKGYRLWDPTLRKIVISRDVTFDESSLLKSMLKELNRNRYRRVNEFSWRLDLSVTVERKERLLETKVLKTQRKLLKLLNRCKFLNQFSNQSL